MYSQIYGISTCSASCLKRNTVCSARLETAHRTYTNSNCTYKWLESPKKQNNNEYMWYSNRRNKYLITQVWGRRLFLYIFNFFRGGVFL